MRRKTQRETVPGEGANRKRRLLPGLAVADGYTVHPFDSLHGVKTSGLVAGRHLKNGHPHDRHATAYYGVAPSVFESLVRRWRKMRPDCRLQDCSFVDLGAGMGRGILLGSNFRFGRVIGVELNATLTRIARRNVARWRDTGKARAPIRVVQGDACEFRFPQGRCLVFLFNPFGAPVMRRVLGSIASQFIERPDELDLLYVNNEQEGELERARGFRKSFAGKVARSRTDAIADHRILANQPDGEYASSNYEDCSIWTWKGK